MRIRDSITRIEPLLENCQEKGLNGLCLTDHETVAGHIELLETSRKMKEEGRLDKKFKVMLGNEIYLIDDIDKIKEEGGKYYHFLLIAKNKNGHRKLRELSSQAWENMFSRNGMERVPITKDQLKDIIGDSRDLIASSACLGSEWAEIVRNWIAGDKNIVRLTGFLDWCHSVFGKGNFYVELQTSLQEEQIEYNKKAVEIAKHYKIPFIVTTDAHFLNEEDIAFQRTFLNSQDGDREVDSFYSSCYIQTIDEIRERLSLSLSSEDIETAIAETNRIASQCEEYTLYESVHIPKVDVDDREVDHSIMLKHIGDYPYIKKHIESKNSQDRYFIHLIQQGLVSKNLDFTTERLERIEVELQHMWQVGEQLREKMSQYYISAKEYIDIMWEEGDSLVGIARGSITGLYCSYLLDITQLDPMKYNLPWWRHIHNTKIEISDVDIDTQALKRERILQAMKNRFGEDNVLNICTFGREGTKSTIQTAVRGLGYDVDIGMYLSSFVPVERGTAWSLTDCLYGNEEKNRKPIKEFISNVELYPDLKETMLKFDSLINRKSVHASGVFFFEDGYLDRNAMMRSSSGQKITQYDMGHSERVLGNIKMDFLTIESLDLIRLTMDFLLEYGYIEWQGSLRKTYNKYLHPDVLDYETEEMWEMVGQGKVQNLFQFSTEIGVATTTKVKPRTLAELSSSNSLMRLATSEDEQPIDRFVRFKDNIEEWYDEMREHGLTEDEVVTLEPHLKHLFGQADTQEDIMEMSMNPKIANFTMKEADTLKSGMAKKREKVIRESKALFFKKGLEAGNSQKLLNYVWHYQVEPQEGYGFSRSHSFPYSCISLQEMNLAYHYPKIFWDTACLTVDSGSAEADENDGVTRKKTTEYGKIASAIANITKNGTNVALPNINTASFGFRPDAENNEIIFGLKGIQGIGDEVVKDIIQGRPYKSFQDFLNKKIFVEGSIVRQGNVIQLIKAGAFDEAEKMSREEIMKHYIDIVSEPKNRITMQNFQGLINKDLIPDKYALQVRFYNYRKYIYSNKPYMTILNNNPKLKKKIDDELFLLDDMSTQFYLEHFNQDDIVEYVNTNIVISKKEFEKEYKIKMSGVGEYIKGENVLEELNEALFEEAWDKHANGSISSWEMESLSYYYHEHELNKVNKDKYDIVNFFDLPEEPAITDWNTYRGKKTPKFAISRIMGTVLDKNKYKHTVTLLTPEGVVTVKMYSGAFGHYDRQISASNGDGTKTVLESSWLKRGQLATFVGYRRDKQFIPKVYNDTIYSHTVSLIKDISEEGDLTLQTERVRIDG